MCLQETGGAGEIQVRKIMFVWNQNIMRKWHFKWCFNMADENNYLELNAFTELLHLIMAEGIPAA